jgi:protein-S-isoprenylcysteine O-methyltransferase Ste14
MGICFSAIWWLFPIAALLLILSSFILIRFGYLERTSLRISFMVSGAFFGFIAFTLPFFQQPFFHNPILQFAAGLPLIAVGLAGRVYALVYLRRQGTTTTLDEVEKLVDTGPYAWVRHPQYSFGMGMLVGWYLLWGAAYSLYMLPLIGGIIYAQASIEEKFILVRIFGAKYQAYRQRVGMFLPRMGERNAF